MTYVHCYVLCLKGGGTQVCDCTLPERGELILEDIMFGNLVFFAVNSNESRQLCCRSTRVQRGKTLVQFSGDSRFEKPVPHLPCQPPPPLAGTLVARHFVIVISSSGGGGGAGGGTPPPTVSIPDTRKEARVNQHPESRFISTGTHPHAVC